MLKVNLETDISLKTKYQPTILVQRHLSGHNCFMEKNPHIRYVLSCCMELGFNTFMFFTCFLQWHNQTSTTAGRAADPIGYSGEKDSR